MLKLLLFLPLLKARVFFHENFERPFTERWTYAEDGSITHGTFETISKEFCAEGDTAIKAVNDSSFYHASSKTDGILDTSTQDLHLSYVTWFQQEIDCGGAYIKLFPELDQKKLTGESKYSVMVGPDVCGPGKRIVHLILNHKDKNYQIKDQIDYSVDKYPHLIQLSLFKDGKFSLKVDEKTEREGEYREHFEYLLPEFIDDPEDTKPEDWDEREMIDDPQDKKPEDWDDREQIPDPNAKKPDDWDDSSDVEWEPNLIKNENYKGEWSPKQIKNEKFSGIWKPKQIKNPDYKEDKDFGKYKIQHVGFDLWMVKSGTVFDEIYLTDSKDESEKHAKEIMAKIKDQITKLKAKAEEDEKKAEEERKAEDAKRKAEEKKDEPAEGEQEPSDKFPESDDEPQKEAHEDL